MNRPAERPAETLEPAPDAAAPVAREAYLFVFRALQEVQDRLSAGQAGPHPAARSDRLGRHVTAAELCEGLRALAAAEFGGLARTVLRQWGLRGTEDVGRVVFELVERGELCKCDGDRPEDFAGLFDFDAAFDRAFDESLGGLALAPADLR